jgi:hypothetical protein
MFWWGLKFELGAGVRYGRGAKRFEEEDAAELGSEKLRGIGARDDLRLVPEARVRA